MVIVLAVATAKALFVMMYFMHLKFEVNWKYVLLAPTTILAIGVPLAIIPDIGLSYSYQISNPRESAVLEATNTGETAPAETEHGGHGH